LSTNYGTFRSGTEQRGETLDATLDTGSSLDPRALRTRKVVLDAARRLILAEGQESVTPTRLVNETHVSRSTIYRQWPDPDDIILEAIGGDTEQPPFEPAGDLRQDLTRYLRLLRSGLDLPHTALLATRIDRAERNEQTATMITSINRGRRQLLAEILQHPTDDFDAAHALIVGPLFHQRFLAREPITDEFIDTVVDAYLAIRPDLDSDYS
jgi:AcrR family transcriptional regulator